MDKETDLDGVKPAKRAEIRRRVAVLKRYVAAGRPSPAEERAMAAELGLGVPQLHNLVRAWKAHGDAARLPGAGRQKGSAKRVDPAIEAEIDRTIDRLGPQAPIADVHRDLVKALGELRTPTVETVSSRVLARRSTTERAGYDRMAVLDHITVALPVQAAPGLVSVPVVSFVADWQTGRILGLSVATVPPSPQSAARALAEALERTRRDGAHWVVRMAVDATDGWWSLRRLLENHGAMRIGNSAAPVPSGMEARAVLGSHLGGLKIVPRLVHSPEGRGERLVKLRMPALSPIEAEDAIRAAVASHNAELPPVRFSLASIGEEADLAAGLAGFGSQPTEPPRRRNR